MLSRSRILTWCAAALLTSAAAGRAQTLAAGAGYPVRGSVVNSATGQPVPRALVQLNADFATLTDGNGQFAFDNVPQHIYVMTVSKPGYLGSARSHSGMGENVRTHGDALPTKRIVAGPDMPSVRLALTPEGVITGQVTLSTGDAPDGIRVQVFERVLRNGRNVWQMAGMVTTRSDGSFRVGDLAPGSYMLNTVASMDNPGGDAMSAGKPVWGYAPVYYPGVTDPNGAGVLNVGPGQQAEADFTLTRQKFLPVTITLRGLEAGIPGTVEILDPGGRPTGFPVHYDPREQMAHAAVPNGTWIAKAQSFGRSIGWGETTLTMASAPVGVAISVQEVPHVPVTIHRDFTKSASQASDSNPGLNVNLTDAEGFAGNAGGYLAHVPGGDSSTWQLNVTEPGKFWLETMPFGDSYVSSITSGGVDLASNPLVVMPGNGVPEVDITMRDDSGSIVGQMSDPQGSEATAAAGDAQKNGPQAIMAWIYAIPLFSTASQLPQWVVTDDAPLNLMGLAPGAYRVVACDAQQEIAYHSPDAVAAWAGLGQMVTVEAGGTANVSLTLEHCEAGAR